MDASQSLTMGQLCHEKSGTSIIFVLFLTYLMPYGGSNPNLLCTEMLKLLVLSPSSYTLNCSQEIMVFPNDLQFTFLSLLGLNRYYKPLVEFSMANYWK